MSTIRVVNIQHSDATEPNIVLEADGTTVFASGITISGGTNLTVSGTAEFASGTVSAPGITFIDDNNTGIYEPAADTVAITTAATERLRIDSSGRVGIGTSSPNADLHVKGGNFVTLNLETTGVSTNQLTFSRSSGGPITTEAIVGHASSDNSFSLQNQLSGPLLFATNATERMRIDSDGRVGIGNTAPSAKLQIEDTSDQLKLTYTSIASYIHEVHSNGDYSVSKDSSERMRINSSGTLTVGPQYDRLNVNPGSGSYDGDPTSVVIDGRTNDGNATAFKIDRFDGSGNASTKFFVNYAGNVGIGTSTPVIDIQAGDSGGFQATSADELALRYNMYYSSGDKYIGSSNKASSLVMDSNGNFIFYNTNTASTSANSAVSGLGERMRILPTGGITFNGDTAQANALDDYEEGTCTLGLTGSGSPGSLAYLHNSARYVKIGSFVFVSGYVNVSNKGSHTGSIIITGLPFTVANNSTGYSFSSVYYSGFNLPTGSVGIGGYPVVNTTTVQVVVDNNTSSGSSNWSYANTSFQLGAFNFMYAIQ